MSPEKLSMKEEDVLTKEEEKSSPIVVPEHVGNGPRTKEQQIRMEKLSEPVMGAEENARRRKEIERRLEGIEKDHDSAWKNKEEKKALGKELVELEGSNKKEKEQDTEEEGSEEKAEDVETNEKLSMDTAKEVFLLKYTDYIKKRRLRESLGISKKEEDWPDELKDLMSKYRDTKISYMQSEYRNRKKELFDDMPDMSNADDIDIDAARRMNDRMDREYFTAEIFNDVELSAQEEVQKAKVEAMGTKEKNLFMKGVEWYSKKSVIPKVLFSTAVVTGALAGGGVFAGAAVGAGAAAGIYAGQKLVRSAVGMLAGVFFGKIAGRIGENIVGSVEKSSEREFTEGFDVHFLDKMEGLSNERLERIENVKKKALIAKTLVAISAAFIAGRVSVDVLHSMDAVVAGSVSTPPTPEPGDAVRESYERMLGSKLDIQNNPVSGGGVPIQPTSGPGDAVRESYERMLGGKLDMQNNPVSGGGVPIQPTSGPGDAVRESYERMLGGKLDMQDSGGVQNQTVENIRNLVGEIQQTPEYIVQPGDNIWKIIENKLEAHDVFRGLSEGQRTYLIDELKDRVSAMSPQELKEFGIGSGDPNLIKAGEHLDFSKIMDTESVNSGVFDAENLTDAQVVSIEANNIKIADWAEAHPNTQLNEGVVDKILNGEMVGDQPAGILDVAILEKVDNLVTQEVESLYGSEGVFGGGFLSTPGERSVDWLDIKTKTVDAVMSKNTFPDEDIWGDEIESVGINSEKIVTKTQEYLRNLIDTTGVQPNLGENVEEYMKRATLVSVQK